MPYLDGTEPEPRSAPKWCPMCKGKLTTFWVGHVAHNKRRGYHARAFPVHACETCGFAVQLRLVTRQTHATRAKARASKDKEIKAKNARQRGAFEPRHVPTVELSKGPLR